MRACKIDRSEADDKEDDRREGKASLADLIHEQYRGEHARNDREDDYRRDDDGGHGYFCLKVYLKM